MVLIADLQALTDNVARAGGVQRRVLEVAYDYLAVTAQIREVFFPGAILKSLACGVPPRTAVAKFS